MRPALVLGAMATSLLVALLAVPSLQRLWDEVNLAVPSGDPAEGEAAGQAYSYAIQSVPQIMAIQGAMRSASRGRSDLAVPQVDQQNGLYAYLQLLAFLPPAHAKPTTRPAEDPGLAGRIHALKDVPPVRLYAGRHWAVALDAVGATGISPRRAAQDANMLGARYASSYRPVLRQVAGGLLAQAKAWREDGRPRDAIAADRAVVRLMLDLVDDSPGPDTVFLAAEYLPAALRDVAREGGQAGVSPEIAGRCKAQAERVEAVRGKFGNAEKRGNNFLPWTGNIVLAQKEHDRMLGSTAASGYAVGAWLALAFVCLALLPAAIGFWRSGLVARWQWQGRGRWVAAGIVVGPMMVTVLVLLFADLPVMWLFSLPSLGSLVWPVLLVPVLVGLAAWLCVTLPDEHERARMTRRVVIIMAALAALVLVLLMIRLTRPDAAWRPPAGVRVFRQMGPLIGLESLVLMLVWMIWGFVRRRRLGLRGGPRAAASLGVAAWAWLAAAVVGFVVLQVNANNDMRHEKAFVAAAADPIGDWLGPEWKAEHFEGARQLLGSMQGL